MYAPASDIPADEPQTTIFGRGGMAFSEDQGATWQRKLPFGVTWHQNDVREPGHVAVAYSGRTASQGTTLDGYITETRNALDVLHGGQPAFWSAFVNSASRPLKFETGIR